MNKDFWKALFMRAIHAVWETAVSTMPAAIIITPAMIEHFDLDTAKGYFYIVTAWLLTAVLSGVLSAIKSAKAGMPEVSYAESLYALENNPNEDVDDFDDEEYEDGDD